ncbi:MAG: GNAT family N-acetyltransferase [Microcystaceae cyanobacterium]
MCEIYVVPAYRRSGVGRSLMEAAFQWGRDKGCTDVELHVLQNSPAKSLYEGLGLEAFIFSYLLYKYALNLVT